jgi:diadenosine tetraphosphate (Ap4A) HIT family hydrolase
MTEADWALHPQLQGDTSPIGDLALCRVLAINDADYPWLILVPRRTGVIEIAELGGDAGALIEEIQIASRGLKDVTGCAKLNIAAIGNVVPQLHIHIVARWINDPLWPKPIWGIAPPSPGDAAAFARFVTAIRKRLGIAEPDSFIPAGTGA